MFGQRAGALRAFERVDGKVRYHATQPGGICNFACIRRLAPELDERLLNDLLRAMPISTNTCGNVDQARTESLHPLPQRIFCQSVCHMPRSGRVKTGTPAARWTRNSPSIFRL